MLVAGNHELYHGQPIGNILSLEIDTDVQGQDVWDNHETAATTPKSKRPRRSLKSIAYQQYAHREGILPDPFFEFSLPMTVNAIKKRHFVRDWQIIRTNKGQEFLISRTKHGCDFSAPLVGTSYASLMAQDDENNFLYVLQGKPRLRDDLKDWRCFCAMSGMDADQSVDITPQVWRLFQAMIGMLKKSSEPVSK